MGMHKLGLLLALVGSVVASVSSTAWAQSGQVKPYFLIIFDTSGSMDDSIDPNSCSFESTKMGAAKCALGRLLNATGDADFGLMQFAQNSCSDNTATCDVSSGSAELLVAIEPNNVQSIVTQIDEQGTDGVDELCPEGPTPLGGSLVAAQEYYEGNLSGSTAPTVGDTALDCRPLSVILLTDGRECCGDCDDAWSGCPTAEAALGIDCQDTCGGDLDCYFESAPEYAYGLRTTTVPSGSGDVQKQIKTYVIGFGIDSGDERIERIAHAGDTDSPDPAVRGFYADNEADLALAFSQIIADAQPPSEVCNNADDDCDELIDEGIPKFCDRPNGIDERELCEEPDETECDGIDDDCDGIVDEGVRNACGTCGDVPAEICNGGDDDCDGQVDEDTGGGDCGTDEGICEKGELVCIDGVEECRGERGPEVEGCNCDDDDCDGFVDEDVDGTLCPDGVCLNCMCVPRCNTDREFADTCEDPLTPEIQPSGECLCVVSNCDGPECAESTIEREGQVVCAPDSGEVASCLCRGGECGALCDGVTCGDGDLCDPRTGGCIENNCRGLGCEEGELCDPLTTECVMDACADADCDDDEVCRAGECEASCAGVECGVGEVCQAGECEDNACFGKRCEEGEVCLDGECIEDRCDSLAVSRCGADGLTCDRESGECVRGACFQVACPQGQTCSEGECQVPTTLPTIGGSPTPGRTVDTQSRVLASGGGGCTCRVTGAPSSGPGAGPWLGLALLGLLVMRRRPRWRRLGPWLVGALLLLLWLPACTIDTFCVDCGDAGSSETPDLPGGDPRLDGGPLSDSGRNTPGDGDGDRTDGGLPECEGSGVEECNGMDDDCDFIVDEDTQWKVNDCDQLGVCNGTEPVCLGGKFSCRYEQRSDDDDICDDQDNDCDGRVDEDFGDKGAACDVGVGACNVTGEMVCNAGGNGLECEVDSTIDPVDEVCDGIDNDCDGVADEPKSAPGDNPSHVQDALVQVAADLWVYQYEASRPDASDSGQGLQAERACSRAGVMPWTNLTYAEAVAACQAADMELCSDAQWVTACEAGDGCAWGWTPDGASCASTEYPTDGSACNGHDLSASPGDPDTDALAPTASQARCFAEHDDGNIFDLSGNAKEWTTGGGSPDANPLRGGSYNNLPGGMRCDFDFAAAADGVRLRNVGFRCCADSAP